MEQEKSSSSEFDDFVKPKVEISTAREDDPFNLSTIANAIKSIGDSMVKVKDIDAASAIQQAQIESRNNSNKLKTLGVITLMILIIALTALFLGKDQLTEKLAFAVAGFLGGIGFGRFGGNG